MYPKPLILLIWGYMHCSIGAKKVLGIVSSDQSHLFRYAGMGKVTDVFNHNKLRQLKGNAAIAHNRYSTTGASFLRNAQPIRVESRLGSMAFAHNGHLGNAWSLRKELESKGTIFQTTVDSEVICHLMAHSKSSNFERALIEAMSQAKGGLFVSCTNERCLICD